MLSNQEIQWNLKFAKNALAQQRLEGLEPSKAFEMELERVARGELSIEQVIANIELRYGNGEIRQSRFLR